MSNESQTGSDRRKRDPQLEAILKDFTELKQQVERRHIENQVRMTGIERENEKMRKELQANTTLTAEAVSLSRTTAVNTEALVAMAKGANTVKKFLIWFSPIAAACFAGLSYWSKKG